MTFFVILIIIVQTFPQALYQVSYYVTMVCIFMACLLEYCILFLPKLRNLWLQKRGLHVPAGRDGDMMAGILGGMTTTVGGRRGSVNNAGTDGSIKPEYPGGVEREKRFGSTAGMISSSERGSIASSEEQRNMNISDLVSSYPFGQINNEHGASSLTSPVHKPTIYGHSNLRGGRKALTDQDTNIDSLDLSEGGSSSGGGSGRQLPMRPSNTGDRIPTADNNQGDFSNRKTGGGYGAYDIFGSNRTSAAARGSRDAQSLDVHEILLASAGKRKSVDTTGGGSRTNGVLTVNHGGHDYIMDSDLDPYSRKSSFGDFDQSGLGRVRHGTLSGPPIGSRSLKSFPVQQQSAANACHSSMKSGMRETRVKGDKKNKHVLPPPSDKTYISWHVQHSHRFFLLLVLL